MLYEQEQATSNKQAFAFAAGAAPGPTFPEVFKLLRDSQHSGCFAAAQMLLYEQQQQASLCICSGFMIFARVSEILSILGASRLPKWCSTKKKKKNNDNNDNNDNDNDNNNNKQAFAFTEVLGFC